MAVFRSGSEFCKLFMRKKFPSRFYSNFSTIETPRILNNFPGFSVVEKGGDDGFRERYCYNLEDKIGQGFFSEVFKGVDRASGKPVAIKRLTQSANSSKIAAQELRVMKQMKSRMPFRDDGLLLHTDAFERQGLNHFVFDWLSGGDLFDEVVDGGTFNESEVRSLLHAIIPSLGNMHKSGFLHRDIKLENFLLRTALTREQRTRSVVLSDYGYARIENEADEFTNIAGTEGYVAPEVLSSRAYSPKSDIWSLGVVVYSCVSGFRPFPLSSSVPEGKKMADVELETIRKGTSEESWQAEMRKPCFAEKSPEFRNLLRLMLSPFAYDRPSVEEILENPFMIEQRNFLESTG